jgi:hypothetical protein
MQKECCASPEKAFKSTSHTKNVCPHGSEFKCRKRSESVIAVKFVDREEQIEQAA